MQTLINYFDNSWYEKIQESGAVEQYIEEVGTFQTPQILVKIAAVTAALTSVSSAWAYWTGEYIPVVMVPTIGIAALVIVKQQVDAHKDRIQEIYREMVTLPQ